MKHRNKIIAALEDAEDETPEGEALAILREVIKTYEKTHGTI